MDLMWSIYIVLAIVSLACVHGDVTDPCLAANHINISHVGERFQTNTRCRDLQISDANLPHTWYYAGSRPILTSEPRGICRCAGSFPIWMNGSLPTCGEEEAYREACMFYPGNPCKHQLSITVKNCGDYFVYKLPPTGYGDSVYCFGETEESNQEPVSMINACDNSTPETSVGTMIKPLPSSLGPTLSLQETSTTTQTRTITDDPDDPCLADNHLNISHIKERYLSNKACAEIQISDAHLPQAWYYAGKQPILASEPGGLCHCAGSFPIWMNGTLPLCYEGEVMRHTCMFYPGQPCKKSHEILIKNCGEYFVYKLQSVLYGDSVYCFGRRKDITVETQLRRNTCTGNNRLTNPSSATSSTGVYSTVAPSLAATVSSSLTKAPIGSSSKNYEYTSSSNSPLFTTEEGIRTSIGHTRPTPPYGQITPTLLTLSYLQEYKWVVPTIIGLAIAAAVSATAAIAVFCMKLKHPRKTEDMANSKKITENGSCLNDHYASIGTMRSDNNSCLTCVDSSHTHDYLQTYSKLNLYELQFGADYLKIQYKDQPCYEQLDSQRFGPVHVYAEYGLDKNRHTGGFWENGSGDVSDASGIAPALPQRF